VIHLALDEVAALAPGRLDRAPWASEVTGVQVDSRRIAEGELFVAVGRGTDFRKHAFARGAAATLVPDDAFAALGAIGRDSDVATTCNMPRGARSPRFRTSPRM